MAGNPEAIKRCGAILAQSTQKLRRTKLDSSFQAADDPVSLRR
jgi:hypothetical protein